MSSTNAQFFCYFSSFGRKKIHGQSQKTRESSRAKNKAGRQNQSGSSVVHARARKKEFQRKINTPSAEASKKKRRNEITVMFVQTHSYRNNEKQRGNWIATRRANIARASDRSFFPGDEGEGFYEVPVRLGRRAHTWGARVRSKKVSVLRDADDKSWGMRAGMGVYRWKKASEFICFFALVRLVEIMAGDGLSSGFS